MINVYSISAGSKNVVQGLKGCSYAWVKNSGESTIYATTQWGDETVSERIAAYEAGTATDTVKIASGSATRIAIGKTLILFGEGLAEVDFTNVDVSPFKTGSKGGGSSGGSTKYIGTTTTALSNGSTTNPITVNGESYTAQFGDIAVYNYTEFIFDGTAWGEFGRNYDTTPTSGSANAVTSNGIYELIRKGTGTNAIAMGYTNTTASGNYSVAMGISAKASGICSVATGMTNATGDYSVAMGGAMTASGANSFAVNSDTRATGASSTAMGYGTYANQPAMTAIGKNNAPRTGDLFNIGNGTGVNATSNIVEVNSTSMNVNGAITQNNTPVLVNAGTLPSLTYDSATEALTFSAGTLPSGGTT